MRIPYYRAARCRIAGTTGGRPRGATYEVNGMKSCEKKRAIRHPIARFILFSARYADDVRRDKPILHHERRAAAREIWIVIVG